MATERHGREQGPDNGGHRGAGPARPQDQRTSTAGNQGAAPAAEAGLAPRLQEGYDATREHLAHSYRQAEGTVARNPGPSILLGFGLGFGLGFLLTGLLAQQREETWAERHLPDSLRHLPDALRHASDALRQVPGSVAHSAHDVASTARDQVRRWI